MPAGQLHEAVLAHAQSGFSIVNVASTAGHIPQWLPPRRAYRLARSDPNGFLKRMNARCDHFPERLRPLMAYSISKHFVIWFSRHLTAEVGRRSSRIVSVSPGTFDTEMGRLEGPNGADELAKHSALSRSGNVEEIAEVLAFLGGTGPGYLTGTDLLVDGGAGAVSTFKDSLMMMKRLPTTT